MSTNLSAGGATGIEHVAVAAKNPKVLAEWYGAALGFRVVATFDNGPERPATYFIGVGERLPYVEIIPADPALTGRERGNTEPGLAHLAILVKDFDASARRVAECGGRPEGAERAAPGGARVQFYRDPDGNLFHILYRPRPLAG